MWMKQTMVMMKSIQIRYTHLSNTAVPVSKIVFIIGYYLDAKEAELYIYSAHTHTHTHTHSWKPPKTEHI